MLKTALGQSPVFRYAKHISTSVNFFFFFWGGGSTMGLLECVARHNSFLSSNV